MQGELIASETELKDCKQIYSDDNVRFVRSRRGMAETTVATQETPLAKAMTRYARISRRLVAPYPSMHTLPDSAPVMRALSRGQDSGSGLCIRDAAI